MPLIPLDEEHMFNKRRNTQDLRGQKQRVALVEEIRLNVTRVTTINES